MKQFQQISKIFSQTIGRAARPLRMLASMACVALAVAGAPAWAADVKLASANISGAADAATSGLRDSHQLVENFTTDLISLIEKAQSYVDKDEPRFYDELGVLLQRYVDFDSFSRAVMGKYASSKRLQSLPAEDRAKLETQMQRFNEVFTGALIGTYGKGLLVFEGERIEVLAPNPEAGKHAAAGKARIKQLIHGDRPEPYVIYYSLRRGEDQQWRIRNMIIESSNLGKIYRNQFDNAYKVYEGDIDRVIKNWVAGAES
ncbi:MAG: ABC transporter substrate-binding protein [Gammaproteobacteria bacterium]|nr:ABC transporter substrate-binding protein [Gammaproteobacteria bacterium]NND40376.1 ABC transporter substrate-binding protein [Pseudomonadales bacterium]MBT8150529.1 ABC transporter substrate-binding protein [Gammaproteobacteria bacterium]NNL10410.1 ABC transporter substrate-binding protein [Pseudomonadales bacterium]NNM12561.1 ABC transporter substrate-binding protein [Pseudomonadales bacterium]